MTVCPKCGHESATDFKFCPECGAPPVRATDERRKTVTVLFCDLTGSTAIGERLDPEALRELMRKYHTELRRILEQHGGTVEKFIGDAAMAVFGIPQAHEDDALRAVRAAEEIRAAVARLELQVRIGVNTGEVVAGEGETLVTGDAVNVAARLEQTAPPGEIVLGEQTYVLLRESVRTEPTEPLDLKGKADPVAAFRLIETVSDVPAFSAMIDAPFVGRDEELRALESALDTAIRERQPQLATVVGPPGIGKSRLVRELVQRADARVLVGRCLSYGEGITYWPLAEVVSQVGDVKAALDEDADAELAASRVGAAVGTSDTPASSDEIAWGFRKLFESLARSQPLIVVFDDIHWAELTFLDLVEYVGGFAQDAPLFVLCTARPDLFEVRPAWATPKPNTLLVTLEPLAAAQTETLVEELRDLSADAKARIVEAAEGNPFFVEQLVAMHAETNGDVQIPPTIHALLNARIDRLEAEERFVIERASIEGRTFHRGSVVELAPEQARARVGSHLITLVRKEFIRPDRATVAGDDGFRFAHLLIRDAAYESIPKRLRAELHERFAEWLEQKLRADTPTEILAYHLEQAYRHRVSIGVDDAHTTELATTAGRLLAEAGRRADARDDAAATRALLERAVELLPDDDPEKAQLFLILGSATFETGDVAAAVELARKAQAAAVATGQRSTELAARMGELRYPMTTSPSADSERVLAEARAAIDELERRDASEPLLEAWQLVAAVAMLRTDFDLWEEAALGALACAQRFGLQREAARATRSLVAPLALGRTPIPEALQRIEDVLAELSDRRAAEHSNLALLYALAGRDADAQTVLERVTRNWLELGHSLSYGSGAMNAGWMALLADDPGRAEEYLRKGAEILEAAGERGWLSGVAGVLAEVLYRLGRYDEAEEWTRRCEEAVPSPEDVVGHALWRSTRAKVLARRGDADAALRLAQEAVDEISRSDNQHLLGDCLAARAEVLELLGRRDEAKEVLEDALAVYERKGIVPSVERTRALLAEAATRR